MAKIIALRIKKNKKIEILSRDIIKTLEMIETKRLYLRALEVDDAAAMFILDSDPEVHRFLGKKPVKHLSESEAQIIYIRQQYRQNGIGRYAVIEKELGVFIGWCGLKLITSPINNHVNFYEIGYRFIKNFWNKGYATESALAWVDYGFNHLKLKEIFAIADINNHNSIKVLENIGLQKIEIFNHEGIPHYWLKIKAPQCPVG